MSRLTYFDLIKSMTIDELADFFYGSPEEEFGICPYCEHFTCAGSPEPCRNIYCSVEAKNKAFKAYLKTDIPEGLSISDILPGFTRSQVKRKEDISDANQTTLF